jgi:hypothetical protein
MVTLTLRILNTRNPLSSGYNFNFDYFDAWDGTRWMPNDALGHYRHLFTYDRLIAAWQKAARPDDQLAITTPDYRYGLRVLWEGTTPHFLLPHGYLFLDWSIPFVDRQTHLALIESGTGVSKTSAVTVAALIYCVLLPDYRFLNAAPSDEQSNLAIAGFIDVKPFIPQEDADQLPNMRFIIYNQYLAHRPIDSFGHDPIWLSVWAGRSEEGYNIFLN